MSKDKAAKGINDESKENLWNVNFKDALKRNSVVDRLKVHTWLGIKLD